MILFKACPRCGGDIDNTYPDDAYCVQCSHRPQMAYPVPRLIEKMPESAAVGLSFSTTHAAPEGESTAAVTRGADQAGTSSCPRCDSKELVRLDKLREQDHTCYRCRTCGHIFSPATSDDELRRAALF